MGSVKIILFRSFHEFIERTTRLVAKLRNTGFEMHFRLIDLITRRWWNHQAVGAGMNQCTSIAKTSTDNQPGWTHAPGDGSGDATKHKPSVPQAR